LLVDARRVVVGGKNSSTMHAPRLGKKNLGEISCEGAAKIKRWITWVKCNFKGKYYLEKDINLSVE
jgi:hypothetical protein